MAEADSTGLPLRAKSPFATRAARPTSRPASPSGKSMTTAIKSDPMTKSQSSGNSSEN